jgi:hypothetical protein
MKEKPDQLVIVLGKDQGQRSTKTAQREVRRRQNSKDQEVDKHEESHQSQ